MCKVGKVFLRITVLLGIVFFLGINNGVIKSQAAFTMVNGGESINDATTFLFDGNDYVTTVTKDEQKIYFKFSVPDGSYGYYDFHTKNLSMTDSYRVFIYSSAMEELFKTSYLHENYEASWNKKLEPGIYYIYLECYYGTGNIKLSGTYTGDGSNDTMQKAAVMPFDDGTYHDSCDGDMDDDFYVFTAYSDGAYRFSAKNLSMSDSFKFKVLAASEEKLYESGYLHRDYTCETKLNLEKWQKYYIKIEGYHGTGNYTFTVKAPTKLTYKGHNYFVYESVNTGVTDWASAVAYCKKQGGHIASITSPEEDKAVYEYVKSQGYEDAYFGLSDEAAEGTWKWATRQPVVYKNWADGEPNSENDHEDYAMYYHKFSDGKWNDGDFNYNGTDEGEMCFICEWDNGISEYSTPKPVSKFTVSGLKYKVVNQKKATVSCVGYDKNMKATLTIPSKVKYNGKSYSVVSIGKNAFKSNYKLKKLTVSKGVVTIGANAFRNCKNLTSATLNQTKTISKDAFRNDGKLKKISITSDYKMKIDKNAFFGINKKASFTVKGKSKKANTKTLEKCTLGVEKIKVK